MVRGEGRVQRTWRVVRVNDEEIVDVASENKHAGVGGGLSEAPLSEPRKEGALPAAAGLRHAVHGFDDAAHNLLRSSHTPEEDGNTPLRLVPALLAGTPPRSPTVAWADFVAPRGRRARAGRLRA
eukprot:4567967-Pleurochrysis_carterae.AAC.1